MGGMEGKTMHWYNTNISHPLHSFCAVCLYDSVFFQMGIQWTNSISVAIAVKSALFENK